MNLSKYKTFFRARVLLAKILCVFLLLIILPTIVMGTFFYQDIVSRTEKELKETNTHTMRLIKKNMDGILSRINGEMWNILLNPQLNEIINQEATTENKILNVAYLKSIIDAKVHTFDVLHSVYVYTDVDGKVLTNDTYKDINAFWDKNYLLEATNDHSLTDAVRVINDGYDNEIKVFSLSKKMPLNSTDTKGLIVFNIDANKLESILAEYMHIERSRLIMVNANKEIAVASSGSDISLLQYISNEDLVGKESFKRYKKFMAFKEKSAYKDYYYVTTVPNSYVDNKTSIIKNTVISICSILILIGIVVSIFLSRYLYNPIDELMTTIRRDMASKNKDSNKIKSELSYLNFAIGEYQSFNTNIQQVLNRNKEHIKHNLFNALFNKEYFDLNVFMESLEWLGIHFKYKNYIVLAISIDKNEVSEQDASYYIDKFAVANIAEEFLNMKEMIAVSVNLEQRKMCLILNYADRQEANESIEVVISQMSDTIHKYLNHTIKLGIGSVVDKIVDISISLKTALQALNYNIVCGENMVLSVKEINMHEDIMQNYLLVEMEKIMNNVRANQLDIAYDILDQLLNDIKQKANLSIKHLKFVTIQLTTLIIKDATDHGMNLKLVLDDEYKWFDEIDGKESIHEITQWVKELFSEILDQSKQVNHTNKDILIMKTLHYIRDYYDKPITIAEIADELGITPQHLSRKFKSSRGQTLIQYINQYRLNKAKELLETTELTVADISERTGFSNSKYFTKRYREHYGITPAAYRDSIKS